jgi:hypothetical protein
MQKRKAVLNMSNDNKEYSDAWRELTGAITQNKVDAFFDQYYKEAWSFYDLIERPHGTREEDFWEWMKEELFLARKRALSRQESVIRALEESLKKNP